MTAATNTVRIFASCLLVACIIFGFKAEAVVASEITGTLSSDGSTDNRDNNTASIEDTNENARTLSGTVVGGVGDSQENFDALNNIIWPVSLALLLMLAVFFLNSRRSV